MRAVYGPVHYRDQLLALHLAAVGDHFNLAFPDYDDHVYDVLYCQQCLLDRVAALLSNEA